MRAPALYFVRHGETDWNWEGRLQGQHDIPLNALGRVQAAEAGRKLCALGVVDERPWLVSPLRRTVETADIARAAAGLPPTGYRLDDRLKELTFGDWEGKTWKELRGIDPAAVRARAADKWGYVPPNGESYAMLHERIGGWLKDIRSSAIIVSHGGVARVLLVHLAGWKPEKAAGADIWQGRVLVVRNGLAEWV